MSVTLIAAIGTNNVIGTDNDLPWHIPEDLKHFKKCTSGKTVLMGRKTWESIPEKFRPLPNRLNIIITRNLDYKILDNKNILVYNDLDLAIKENNLESQELFVIGGGKIYEQTIKFADALEITHVDQAPDGDAKFPQINKDIFKEVGREDHDGFSFVRYERA